MTAPRYIELGEALWLILSPLMMALPGADPLLTGMFLIGANGLVCMRLARP